MKVKQRPDRPGVGQLVVTVPIAQQTAVEEAIAALESSYGIKGSQAVVRALLETATQVRNAGAYGAGASVRPGLEADLDAIDDFAVEVGAAWKDDMSAVDAVREQRRDL